MTGTQCLLDGIDGALVREVLAIVRQHSASREEAS